MNVKIIKSNFRCTECGKSDDLIFRIKAKMPKSVSRFPINHRWCIHCINKLIQNLTEELHNGSINKYFREDV